MRRDPSPPTGTHSKPVGQETRYLGIRQLASRDKKAAVLVDYMANGEPGHCADCARWPGNVAYPEVGFRLTTLLGDDSLGLIIVEELSGLRVLVPC